MCISIAVLTIQPIAVVPRYRVLLKGRVRLQDNIVNAAGWFRREKRRKHGLLTYEKRDMTAVIRIFDADHNIYSSMT